MSLTLPAGVLSPAYKAPAVGGHFADQPVSTPGGTDQDLETRTAEWAGGAPWVGGWTWEQITNQAPSYGAMVDQPSLTFRVDSPFSNGTNSWAAPAVGSADSYVEIYCVGSGFNQAPALRITSAGSALNFRILSNFVRCYVVVNGASTHNLGSVNVGSPLNLWHRWEVEGDAVRYYRGGSPTPDATWTIPAEDITADPALATSQRCGFAVFNTNLEVGVIDRITMGTL